ncbi:hypothetical protein DPMN_152394 [Dreissena polymorpha]|uniref:Uncharacterized protein n=1 Tax=Dreissena polymorpha TaxID=45954 RepID=A0A9D4FL66_DREPO|nr:hypothetical protein DPMN_152394 [Dreissena polymorpha]
MGGISKELHDLTNRLDKPDWWRVSVSSSFISPNGQTGQGIDDDDDLNHQETTSQSFDLQVCY